MRKLLLPIMLCAVAGPAYADKEAVTVRGYYACAHERLLEDFEEFASAGDTGSMRAYLDRGLCFSPLKAGLRVVINHESFATYGFIFEGVQLYAPREALAPL